MSFRSRVTVVLSFAEEAAEGEWCIEGANAKLGPSAEANSWRVAFKEGVDFVEDIFKRNYYEETPEECSEYGTRYDLTYVSPCGHQLRCKVS